MAHSRVVSLLRHVSVQSIRCATRISSKPLVSYSTTSRVNILSTESKIYYSTNTPMRSVTPELRTMKLTTPEFQSLLTPELGVLVDLFKKYNHELRIAGGAVRDLLGGNVPHDVDFATTATPDEMKKMFENEGIRMLNMKGEKHGTITCRINDKENFEVTTLRIDVVTDGRHAEVEFSKDWELDALRRDLTVNSMFLDMDGVVYDYFRGKEDLENHKVRFVGNPIVRIQEDYLRILRYFRFYGRISENENAHEPDTLKAIRDNVHGLKGISGERIWVEMKKILQGRFSGPIMRVMLECDMAKYIGLPTSCNIDEFEKVWQNCKDMEPLPFTLLPALMDHEEQMYALNDRLKLSKDELHLGLFVLAHRDDEMGDNIFHYCQDLWCDTSGKEPKIRERIIELMKYCNHREALDQFKAWDPPRFPVNGHSLLAAGVPKGPPLAKTLNAVRVKWKESRFAKTEEELMSDLPEILKRITNE